MKQKCFSINGIPAVLYGEKCDRVYLFVHGKYGYKEEAAFLADTVCKNGWQVLGIDLPKHGSRNSRTEVFCPQTAVPELKAVLSALHKEYTVTALYAISIGAWFSMLAFSGEVFEKCLFVSPILDMEKLVRNMMAASGVTEEILQQRGTVDTAFDEKLDWEYLQYIKSHPIDRWDCNTAILYAGKDNLTDRTMADGFAKRFGCRLTVYESGEHWFHTEEQLSFLKKWLAENTK